MVSPSMLTIDKIIFGFLMLAQEPTCGICTVAFSRSPVLRFCAKITQYAQKAMILYKIGLDQHKDLK